MVCVTDNWFVCHTHSILSVWRARAVNLQKYFNEIFENRYSRKFRPSKTWRYRYIKACGGWLFVKEFQILNCCLSKMVDMSFNFIQVFRILTPLASYLHITCAMYVMITYRRLQLFVILTDLEYGQGSVNKS